MSMVDNRVVKMTFDNAQFEKNIKDTIKSLKEFEEKLKLDGASAGFETVGKAADKLNLSTISEKAKDMASKVGLFSKDASDSIDKIDDNVDKIDFSVLGKLMGTEAEKIESASSEASKSIDGIDSTASDVSFSPISASADQMSSDVISAIGQIDSEPIISEMSLAEIAFQSLEAVAFGALMNIGNRIMDTVVDWGKGILNGFVSPIKDGFGEYETQINSIQTIIANTGMSFDSDEDIAAVNAELDKLNTYADETIYNFTEMTKAIGTFTSSGLNLWDASETVKGVANVAALAGAQTSEMNRVLPQIGQALSAGSVSQQDWMSIQTAHMDSRIFVNAIGDMAMHMAEAGLAEENAFEAGRRILEEGANMRLLLNKQDSKDIAGWFSSDILSESLRLFTYDRRKMTQEEIDEVEAHLKELGYAEEEYARVFEQAEMAARAATEVRTWSQLKDTIGESIGSNWSGIWRNFIGDFKQATDTFTFLSETLSNGIDSLFSGIVNAFRIFNKYEHGDGTFSRIIEDFWGSYARYEEGDYAGQKVVDEVTGDFIRIKGALDYIVEAITKPLGAIKDAFDMVFGISDEELFLTISSLVLAFKDFAASLVISDNAAIGIYETFTGVFTVLKIVIQVVADLVAAFFGLVGVIRTVVDPMIDIVLMVFGQIGKIISWIGERFFQLRASVIEAIYPVIEVIGILGDIVSAFFGFADIPSSIDSAGDSLIGFLDIIWDFIDLPGKLAWLSEFIRTIFGFIGDLTGWNQAVAESAKIFNETGQEVSAVDIFIAHLLENPVIAFIAGIIDAIKKLLGFIVDIGKKIFDVASFVGGGLVSIIIGTIGLIFNGLSGLGGLVGKLAGGITGFFTNTGKESEKAEKKTESFFDKFKKALSETKGQIARDYAEADDGGMAFDYSKYDKIFEFFEALRKVTKDVPVINSVSTILSKFFRNLAVLEHNFGPATDMLEKFKRVFISLNWVGMSTNNEWLSNFAASIRDGISRLQESFKLTDGFMKRQFPEQGDKFKVSRYDKIFEFIQAIKIASKDVPVLGTVSKAIADFFYVMAVNDHVLGPVEDVLDYIYRIMDALNKSSYTNGNKGLASLFGTLRDSVADVREFLKAIDFKQKLLDAFNMLVKLAGGFALIAGGAIVTVVSLIGKFIFALVSLGKHIFDFVKASEPVQGFLRILEDAKNGVIGWFLDLPNKLSGLGKKTSDEITKATNTNPIVNFIGVAEKAIEYIKNVSPDKLVSDVANVFNGVRQNVKNFIEYIKNVDPEELGNILKEKLIFAAKLALGAVVTLFEYLKTVFPSLAPILDGVFKTVLDVIQLVVLKVTWMIEYAKRVSSNGPEFIGTLIGLILREIIAGVKKIFGTLISLITVGIAGVVLVIGGIVGIISKFLQDFDVNELVDSFVSLFKDVGDVIRTKLGEINPAFQETFDKIAGFFKRNEDDTIDWGEVIKGALNGVKNFIISLPGKILKAFNDMKKHVKDFAETTIGNLSKMDNPVGSIFKRLKDRFFDADDTMKGVSDSIPTSLGGLTESVGGALKDLDSDSGVLSKLVELWNQFTGADGREGSFLESLKKFFGDKAKDLINWLKDLMPDFGDLLDAFLGCFTEERIQKIADIIYLVVKTRMMWGLYDLFKGLGSLCRAVARRLSPKDAKSFAGTLREWAITLTIMAAALWIISKIQDPWKCVGVITALGAVLVALEFLAGLIELFGKKYDLEGGNGADLLMAASSIVVLIGAIVLFAKAAEWLNGYDFEGNAKGLAAAAGMLVIFGLSLAGLTRIMGNNGDEALQVAAAIGIMILEIWILIPVIKKLDELTKEMGQDDYIRIGGALAAIAAFIAAIAGALRLAGEHPLAAAVGIILVAAAISIIGDAIIAVSNLKYDSAALAIQGFIILLGEFALMAKYLKPSEMLATGAAILIFATSMTVLSYGLSILAENKWESIRAASIILVSLLAVLALMTAGLKASDLALTSAALVVFGVAIGVLALGLGHLAGFDSDGIMAAAKALGILLGIFGAMVLVLSLPIIRDGAVTILPLLSLAFIALGAACWLIAQALETAVSAIIHLAAAGPILTTFVVLISQHAGSFLLASVALLALGAAMVPFGLGAMAAGAGLILLSNGIREFLVLIAELPVLLQSAGEAIPTILAMLWEGISGWWTNLTTWFFEEAIPAIGEWLLGIISTLGEKWEALKAWWTENVWPVLSEAIGKFWNWAKTKGIPKVAEFVSGLLGKAGELKDKFLAWLQSDGIPMLQKAGSDFMNWVQTDGIPKLVEFAGKLKDWLGERKDKFVEWIKTDGLDMVRDGLDKLIEKAGEFGSDLAEWASKIPDWISDAVSDLWEDLGNVGSYIVQGIGEGISGGYEWINNAINNLGDWAVQGIKDFFGIDSPSKLMRDEVGVYLPAGVAEGIIQNAKVVGEASASIADEAVSGANRVLSKAEFDSVSPNITPVMDIDSFGSAVDAYSSMVQRTMSGADLITNSSLRTDIGVDSLSSSLATAIDADINRLKEVESTLGDIANALTESNKLYVETNNTLGLLNSNTNAINERLQSGTNLYLDSRALVGMLAPDMDRVLGQRMSLAGRGVY